MRSGLLLFSALLLASCGPRPPSLLPLPDTVPQPDPRQVDGVVFLLGDAGQVRDDNSPVLVRLRQDIEQWSANLGPGGEVAVLLLGDILYPEGVRAPDTNDFHADTAVVMSQVRLVDGPHARARGARAYFLAGNHDWGSKMHWPGFVRLKNLDDVLNTARAQSGVDVRLAPDAGTGGPYVVDFGSHLRILLLDTAWWLLEADPAAKVGVLEGIDAAMASAGNREVMFAAHHPFKSGGPHGGKVSFWRAAGARYLLTRSGAILQDLSSIPYRALEYGLRATFGRHGSPLIFAGGHEHSLQVIARVRPTDPHFSLVSGSGSKLSDIGHEDGMHFAGSIPGYMRLVVERGGGVALFVEATDPRYLKCPDADPDRGTCLAEGMAAFQTVYSQRLR